MADWTQLPTELLELIVGRLETSFEIVHFRSVCRSWRSVVPSPDNFLCLGIKTHIPFFWFTFNGEPPLEKDDYCTLKKIPIFILRFNIPFGFDYLLAEIRERNFGKPMLMSSPLSCDGIACGRHKMLFNSLTTQFFPFGHYYEITYYEKKFSVRFGEHWKKTSERVEFLKLDGEDCKDFVVLHGINTYRMLMFTSCNMSWTRIMGLPETYHEYQDMVAFKGKFFVVDSSGWGQVFAIELSLKVTEIPLVGGSHNSDQESLVKSGEELLLVQRFLPENRNEYIYTWFRVFRLDEEEGRMKWVQVNDLNDRVIFLGPRWNLCCSVQKLPGAKENCIVFIDSTDGIIVNNESILLFDLRTRRTSTVFSESRGCKGSFGANLESLVFCGVVTLPNSVTSVYDEMIY